MSFTIKDLQQKEAKQKRRLIYVYRNIFEICKKKIIHNHNIGVTSFMFFPPERITGEPDYNLLECLCFLIKKLRNAGFTVFYKKPSKLLIIWEGLEKYENLIQNTKFLYTENKNTENFQKNGNIFKLLKYSQEKIDYHTEQNKNANFKFKKNGQTVKLPKLKYNQNHFPRIKYFPTNN